MTLGGAAQVAGAHCPNEGTLDPAVCSYNRPTYSRASRTMAFTPQYTTTTNTTITIIDNEAMAAVKSFFLSPKSDVLCCLSLNKFVKDDVFYFYLYIAAFLSQTYLEYDIF